MEQSCLLRTAEVLQSASSDIMEHGVAAVPMGGFAVAPSWWLRAAKVLLTASS